MTEFVHSLHQSFYQSFYQSFLQPFLHYLWNTGTNPDFSRGLAISTIIGLLILNHLWNKTFKIQREVIQSLFEQQNQITILRNALWALELTRSSFPTPPTGIPEFQKYTELYNKFRRETDALSLTYVEFLTRWLLLEGRGNIATGEIEVNQRLTPAEQTKALKEEALEFIENILETLEHYERLNNIFIVQANSIHPNFKLPDLLITARGGIREAENYIKNVGK